MSKAICEPIRTRHELRTEKCGTCEYEYADDERKGRYPDPALAARMEVVLCRHYPKGTATYSDDWCRGWRAKKEEPKQITDQREDYNVTMYRRQDRERVPAVLRAGLHSQRKIRKGPVPSLSRERGNSRNLL